GQWSPDKSADAMRGGGVGSRPCRGSGRGRGRRTGAWRDPPGLSCVGKLIECLLHCLSSLLGFASLMFVIHRELLVGVIPMPRITECMFPKLTCQIEITLPLCEPCQ